MAFVPFELRKCPQCGEAIEIRVAGVYSGLGPSRRVCRRCDHVVASDRCEWQDMSASDRGRYALWSFAYMLVAGGVGGGILQGTVNVIRNGFRDGLIPQVDVTQPIFWVGFAGWFGIIGLVQSIRVVASVYRSNAQGQRSQTQFSVPLFLLQFGWHIPIAILLVMPLFVGWIVAFLKSP